MTRSNTPMMVDRFRILSLLGRGAMSRVYRAWDTKLGREVAIKMAPRHLPEPERVRRLHEAQVIAQLSHPNIVQIFDSAPLDAPTPYMVIERLRGEDLFGIARTLGPLEERFVLAIAYELSAALEATHEARVIHRDIKPENVVLTHDGRIVLTDFGIAKVFDADANQVVPTDKTDIIGTPGFMAPEAMRGEAYSVTIDLFGLGGLMYNLLTGQMPFAGRTHLDIYHAAKAGKMILPKTHGIHVSKEMMRLIRACLSPETSDRPQTAEAVQKSLTLLLKKNRGVTIRETLRELSARAAHPETGPKRRRVARLGRLKELGANQRRKAPVHARRFVFAASLFFMACSLLGHLTQHVRTGHALLVPAPLAAHAPVVRGDYAISVSPRGQKCSMGDSALTAQQEVLEEFRPQALGRLGFDLPPYARVSLDGHIIAAHRRAPWPLAPGPHAVVVRVSPNFEPVVARFVVSPGADLTLITKDDGTTHVVS